MTRRSRRELEQRLADLEAATLPSGEDTDPPELTRDEKHALAELFDTDVWDPAPDVHATIGKVHDRNTVDTDR